MRFHRTILLLTAALAAFGSASARGETGWSAVAKTGLAFMRQGENVTSGGWFDLLHSMAPNASVGAEVGYIKLPGVSYVYPAVVGYTGPTGKSLGMLGASGVFRVRSAGPARVHLLGTFGYYDLSTRTHFNGNPDRVEHEGHPVFSLAIGVSGSGLVRPGFQLRWHEVVMQRAEYFDVISFEAGLHFN